MGSTSSLEKSENSLVKNDVTRSDNLNSSKRKIESPSSGDKKEPSTASNGRKITDLKDFSRLARGDSGIKKKGQATTTEGGSESQREIEQSSVVSPKLPSVQQRSKQSLDGVDEEEAIGKFFGFLNFQLGTYLFLCRFFQHFFAFYKQPLVSSYIFRISTLPFMAGFFFHQIFGGPCRLDPPTS